MKVVLANSFTKRQAGVKDNINRINGNKLSRGEPRVVRKADSLKKPKMSERQLVSKVDFARNDLTPEDGADVAVIMEHEEGPEVKTIIVSKALESVSGDVIFNPMTQSTQYSASRAVKTNLERRIPGSTVRVGDVGGDGLVTMSLSIDYEVEGQPVNLQAKSLASATDMTIVQAVVNFAGKSFDIDPIDQARSPEETARFLKRLATNCVVRE